MERYSAIRTSRTVIAALAILLVFTMGLVVWFSVGQPSRPGPSIENNRITDLTATLPLPEKWSGDLDGMLERRLVRILVPYNKMLYFHDRGQERGIVHDAGMELENWLNRKYGDTTLPIRVVFIPSSREFLLDNLNDGVGDIAAGNLTITPARLEIVDFTVPSPLPVNEIVVTGPQTPRLETLDDLAKVPILVRRSSSYYEHLVTIDNQKRLGLDIRLVDEAFEDEELLEMVNAGLLPLAIVDNHKALFWSKVFDGISLREDLVINRGGRIAWAIRKNSPQLMAELNAFRTTKDKTIGLTNMLLKRYLGSTRFVDNALNEKELGKYDRLKDVFRTYAEKFELDILLLMAQAYQESRYNQHLRSRSGAVGIMQILPSTASEPPISIHGVEKDPERNIHAGAKYMRYLLDTYLDEPQLDETNRLLLGLAAYNAGPGNLAKMRRKAAEMGLNPHVWFNHVEHGAARVIGRETVQYVSNIYKYYLAYRLVEEDRRLMQEKAEVWKLDGLDRL